MVGEYGRGIPYGLVPVGETETTNVIPVKAGGRGDKNGFLLRRGRMFHFAGMTNTVFTKRH